MACYTFNPFTPKSAKLKTEGKNWNLILHNIVNNKQYPMKVLLNSFQLNGHTLGFHPQTQKLEPHLLAQGSERVKVRIILVVLPYFPF